MSKRVFLGGTCNDSTWRDALIPMLTLDYFNPVVPEWTDAAYQEELLQRETCDYCLYILTPRMAGYYSIAEAVDDSNKRPEKTVFCYLESDGEHQFTRSQLKSLVATAALIQNNGGHVCYTLEAVAAFLNESAKSNV